MPGVEIVNILILLVGTHFVLVSPAVDSSKTDIHSYRRRRRRADDAVTVEAGLYEGYRSAKKELQVAIREAKSAAWVELLGTLDNDPWGRPYHLVRNKLRPWAPPLTQSLPPPQVADIVGALFPSRAEHPPPAMAPPSPEPSVEQDQVPAVTREELGAAVLRLKAKNTAPGLDGIPGRAWVLSHGALESRLTWLFTACLQQGRFPTRWKTGKLVLLRKEGNRLLASWGRREMTCGVPQGSVLGPLLWNIAYDWTIRGAVLHGVSITCYADDTLVAARGRTHRQAGLLATAGVAHVIDRIRRLGLEVAFHKSEAVVFHGPRNKPPPGLSITVGGTTIGVGTTMKYLGLVLDSRWELMGAAGALSRLVPNVGGPGAPCRKLYEGVVRSMALYGAPIWAESLTAKNAALLRRPQRVLAVRAIRGYRTISFEAASLLAGSPPWDLEARVLAAVYDWRKDALSRDFRPGLQIRCFSLKGDWNLVITAGTQLKIVMATYFRPGRHPAGQIPYHLAVGYFVASYDKPNSNNNLDLADLLYIDKSIKHVNCTKFLGLYIDNKLTWKFHTDEVCARLSKFSYALYMMSKVVNVNSLLIAFHAYVTSVLRYGIIFWGFSTDRERIFKAQKKCLRCIFHLKQTDTCKPFFIDFKILTFPSLYIFEIIMLIKNNPTLFENYKSARHINKNKICMPPHTTALYDKSVFGMAPRIYNKLPYNIMQESNIHIFKQKLFEWLTKKSYYSVQDYLNER
ncbi:hypothetical protein K1T71_000988 [Dendrolimus kikuchii]|uniref:Uncharacterized protein n=1 Tax=Dendrolimus kikuchii TaxID=765133 RepID=A0ACC1DHC4_9NEOP|nr:hypothetical protein K1T71_000988 [Dendrolimus kikuchii]